MVRSGHTRLVLFLAVSGTAWSQLRAQPYPSTWQGVPEQVLPSAREVGIPVFITPLGQPSSPPNQGGSTGGGSNVSYSGGGAAALQTMMSQSYGQIAYDTAQRLGNNPLAVAGIGQLESGFRNVPTANGSSSATGPWQIVSGTWNDYVQRYNLPYTAADRTNTAAQAVVANYIIKDYAAQVSNATGQPATVAQTYGAFVFGPTAGKGIASANPSEPLSNFVSARGLSNNNMTGWTVAQFNNRVTSKVGDLATQTVQS